MRNQVHDEGEKVFKVFYQMFHLHEFVLIEAVVIRPERHSCCAVKETHITLPLDLPGQCHNQKHTLWLTLCHKLEGPDEKRQTKSPLINSWKPTQMAQVAPEGWS